RTSSTRSTRRLASWRRSPDRASPSPSSRRVGWGCLRESVPCAGPTPPSPKTGREKNAANLPKRNSEPRGNILLDLLDRILDRLEEWIIGVLIAAATCITFVAVVHRYGASNSVGLANWANAHGLTLLGDAADWVYVSLLAINLSWAQELATYMFVWMAKFGAALGVRTGIHVGVDVFVKRLSPEARKPVI